MEVAGLFIGDCCCKAARHTGWASEKSKKVRLKRRRGQRGRADEREEWAEAATAQGPSSIQSKKAETLKAGICAVKAGK